MATYNRDMDLREPLRRYFADCPDGVSAVWLFGSRARGAARPDSDVDVGVLWSTEPSDREGTSYPPEVHVAGDLEAILGLPAQVVAMDRAPADLVHRVLRDGELVYEGDRSHRIRFEVRARNEYFDLLPHLRRYRRRAVELLEEAS